MKYFFFLISLTITLIPDAKATKFPTKLEADKVEGDRKNNIITATGNVEVTNGTDKLTSDKVIYNKNKQLITAIGDVRLKNNDIGNIFSEKIDIKDDFNKGELIDGKIIFNDGSYVKAPRIIRESKTKSIFKNSIFSFCPNPIIKNNHKNTKNDISLISLKSRDAIINKEDGSIKIKSGFFRVKDVPFFYTPYIRVPLQSSKRKSGFLHSSYTNTNNLGFGLRIPYYFNIAPNKDLTTTLQYHPANKNLIIKNHYRHLLKNGEYDIKLENANNNIVETSQAMEERWMLDSAGDIKISDNIDLNFNIKHTSDEDYLRDYHNDFTGYNVSYVDFDHIEDNNYNSIKLLDIQELELDSVKENNSIPIFNSYFEKRGSKLKETYSIQSNATILSKNNGLQYKRLSLIPKITIPKNIYGNIFKLSASLQGDLYNIDDTDYANTDQAIYKGSQENYRPQTSLSWNLPLIKKSNNYSLIIEPKANFVNSSYSKDYRYIINEDTNNIELTQNNLFFEDRFLGFDRNESGQRLNYGINSKLFNSVGDFGFGLGQGYRKNNKVQDVTITGFNNGNKSNIVGSLSYKSPKMINFIYNFQLNNENYENEVSDINLNMNFNNFNISSNYLFIKEDAQSNAKQEQVYLGFRTKIYGNVSGYLNMTKDMVGDQVIMKRLGVNYDGCCVTYGFSAVEHKPVQFLRAEKSYNIHFTIKNL